MSQRDLKLQEAKKNYEFYKSILETININKHGKYLLLKNKEIIDYFSNVSEARAAAESKFRDGIYSIQKVAEAPAELGFYRADVSRVS